jgi:hypothetical protein
MSSIKDAKTLKQLSTSRLQKQICLKIQINYFALCLIGKIFFEMSIKNYLSEEFVKKTVKQNGDSLGEMKDVISTNRCVNKALRQCTVIRTIKLLKLISS